jgi:hypothetical protein
MPQARGNPHNPILRALLAHAAAPHAYMHGHSSAGHQLLAQVDDLCKELMTCAAAIRHVFGAALQHMHAPSALLRRCNACGSSSSSGGDCGSSSSRR